MTPEQLIDSFVSFFVEKNHQEIPGVSLIPENDPSVLFTTAGMHPLVPYLLGEPHPLGKRLISLQKCLRTDDIDEAGDKTHHTFFEMLGNWSLGDYFKKEAIEASFEFLTSGKWLKINKNKLAVSVFAGDETAPFDRESYNIWLKLGVSEKRIAKLPKKNNWWGPVGQTGPCGPDTEMFIWTGKKEAPEVFDANDLAWVEVWNNVFMEFNKTESGKFELLEQKNVDTGMGVERMLAVLNGYDDDYKTDLFWPIIQTLEAISRRKYQENAKEFRIIADHIKAAAFLAREGLKPSNKQQGYVMRRLIRRAIVKMMQLDIVPQKAIPKICQKTTEIYKNRDKKNQYFDEKNPYSTHLVIGEEADAFLQTIHQVTKLLQKETVIDGKRLFDLYQTWGLPFELAAELLEQWEKPIDKKRLEEEFNEELTKHQQLSRTTSAGMFKGGLVDQTEIVTKYHTATHLLQTALRKVLGKHVRQKGSNINAERLRFDFANPEKVSPRQLERIEALVNQEIVKNSPVKMEVMDLDRAVKEGALTVPNEKYPEKVKVYAIGDFSNEVCGGPHVAFTGSLGSFKIIKEESAGSSVRRVYAILKS